MKIKEKWVAWEELLPGFTPATTIDFQQVGGLAPGSIPFADAEGFLTQDNANFFWDETNARLSLNQVVPTARIDIVAEGAYPGINIAAGGFGEMSTPDGQQFRWGHWNEVDTFTERLKFDAAGIFYISYLTVGSVVFAGAGGEIKQDNADFYWDTANKRLGIGKVPANVLDVDGAGTVTGGTSYGGVIARFSTTDDKHVSVSIDANTSKDPVLNFAEDGSAIWDVRNDASATDEFQIRYQVGEVNRTDFKINNAGNVSITTGTLSLILELNITSATAPLIDLNPAFIGTGNVIDITPSASLVEGRTWHGIYIDANALDPATGDSCIIHGFHFDATGLASIDHDANIVGFVTTAPVQDSFTGFSATLRELTQNKTQNAFRSFGGTPVLSGTGTYNGLFVDWDNITRDGGAPVLHGIHVLLPADYSDFGVSHAGYFEGDGRSVTICNATYALDVSGLARFTALTITDIFSEDHGADHNLFLGYLAGAGIQAGGKYNVLIGENAGAALTTADRNVIIGYNAGVTGTTLMTNCVYIGQEAGKLCTAGSNVAIGGYSGRIMAGSTNNVLLGYATGYSLTGGAGNLYLGTAAGFTNIVGSGNVAIGSGAGYKHTGSFGNYIGNEAGYNVTVGQYNIIIGYRAAYLMTVGGSNIFIGHDCGRGCGTSPSANTCIGMQAAYELEGLYNVILGYMAAHQGTTQNDNTVVGYQACYYNVTGDDNVILGYQAAYGVTTNSHANNVIIGHSAAKAITTGGNNVIIGKEAADDLTSGTGNVVIGYMAAEGSLTTGNNQLWIANSDTATPLIYGEFDNGFITINGYLNITTMKSGATQVASGAGANELWYTVGHATLPDNVVMMGI